MISISQAPSGWSMEAARGTRNVLFVAAVSSPSAASPSSQIRASTTAFPVTRDDSPHAAPTANRWKKTKLHISEYESKYLVFLAFISLYDSDFVGLVSHRSWFRVALRTETSPGIKNVSCVWAVKSSWPDSLSQRRVKIRTAWSASATCTPKNVPPATNPSRVSVCWCVLITRALFITSPFSC